MLWIAAIEFIAWLVHARSVDQNDLAGYFGRFYGVCGGVALAIQVWVTSRVLIYGALLF